MGETSSLIAGGVSHRRIGVAWAAQFLFIKNAILEDMGLMHIRCRWPQDEVSRMSKHWAVRYAAVRVRCQFDGSTYPFKQVFLSSAVAQSKVSEEGRGIA